MTASDTTPETRLLKIVASRLSGVLRGTDFAARLGGDEFCLLTENIHGRTQHQSADAKKERG